MHNFGFDSDEEMKNEHQMEKGLYFLHGYYLGSTRENDIDNIYRDQMILMKDSFEEEGQVEAFDVNVREVRMEERIPNGEFVYYNGETVRAVPDSTPSITYSALNNEIVRSINYENYGAIPQEDSDDVSDVYSYHVNVGHGNCSLIVFKEKEQYVLWMVDCSVYDYTNRRNNSMNLDACLKAIEYDFGVGKISRLFITHLHYDHINGIEHLISNDYIDSNTEVWMNIQYPWKQPTYNRILLKLQTLGVTFIDPIVGNSTKHIKIMYPKASFNKANKAPGDNINNSSVIYQICLAGKSMLFTGDIETEGWNTLDTCMPNLKEATYYCISHHGSLTGHLRDTCLPARRTICNLSDCASESELQILMGRDGAYKGIINSRVLADFDNIWRTELCKHYIMVDWSNDSVLDF